MNVKKILAIPGSLRAASSSNIVLQTLTSIVAEKLSVKIYDGVGMLPHFNDPETLPEEVSDFLQQLREADGIIICTPEYAFGVPGSLKNALDWTVGSGELVQKPLALITASSSGEKGHAALIQILTALSADVKPGGTLLIPAVRSMIKDGKLSDLETIQSLRSVAQTLINQVTA